MEKVFHDNGNGTINVSCTYEDKDYIPVVGKVVDRLCSEVTVKGFRKGKAPKEVAQRYVSNEDIYNGMVNKLIDKDFATLLEGYKDIEKVANIKPSLNVTFDQKAKKYNFLYTFVNLPEADVKKCTGYDIESKAKAVTDADVKAEISKLLTDNAELVPSKDSAATGDHVIIDFTGYMDGKEFDGGSGKDYDLTLGSKSFVPGFEDALVGIKEGDRKSINITFPKDYLASLANKPAKFSVICKGVKKIVLPEENDEFASTLTEYKVKTMEELRKAVKEKLAANAKATARREKITKIFAALEKDSKVIIADEYLNLSANQVQESQLGQFKQYGLTLEEYLKIAGTTMDQFKDNCKKIAKEEATRFALVRAVSSMAEISATDDDMEKRFGGKEKYAKLLEAANEQHVKNPSFNAEGYFAQVKDSIVQEKVEDYLVANN